MKREKVYCEAVKANVYKDTKGCLGYSCDTCPELKSIHSKEKTTQKENDGKDRYRKKKYIPQKITQNSLSKYLLKEYQKNIN